MGSPRGDKVFSLQEAKQFLSGEVLVEEKLDGANIGISLSAEGDLRVQNRGQYLEKPYIGQFSRLQSWLGQHQYKLLEKLEPGWILFGEWCAARHSLEYDSLPDWFVLFDVYDLKSKKFWSSSRRDELAATMGLRTISAVFRGKTNLRKLTELLDDSYSLYRSGSPEGLVVRKQNENWCEARAKLVKAEFTQAIDEHWRNRHIEWNRLNPELNY